MFLGKTGEEKAVRFLKKKGCTIIETNYRNKIGEIDIIGLDRGVLIFVEVKTRKDNASVSPKEAVTPQKQKKIAQVAQTWLKIKNKHNTKARFDVIAILSDQGRTDIEWVKNAFELPSR
jgi:putative endonuclease